MILFLPEKILPRGGNENQISEIHQLNHSIRERISRYKMNTPSRYEAFNYAHELEISAGEAHYEMFMNENPGSNVEKVFQKLNGQDKNHAHRIIDYMKLNKITKIINLLSISFQSLIIDNRRVFFPVILAKTIG